MVFGPRLIKTIFHGVPLVFFWYILCYLLIDKPLCATAHIRAEYNIPLRASGMVQGPNNVSQAMGFINTE